MVPKEKILNSMSQEKELDANTVKALLEDYFIDNIYKFIDNIDVEEAIDLFHSSHNSANVGNPFRFFEDAKRREELLEILDRFEN